MLSAGRDFNFPVRWMWYLLTLAGTTVLPLPAAPPKKRAPSGITEFHQKVLISMGGSFRIGDGGAACIDPLVVFLAHETFFERLIRVQDPSDFGWRYFRDGKAVEYFPESLSVEIYAVPIYCDERIRVFGFPDWGYELRDFMDYLRFEILWRKGTQEARAKIISTRTKQLLARQRGGPAPQWRYYLEIESANVPITASLSVEILSEDGRKLTRVISGMERASPWPP